MPFISGARAASLELIGIILPKLPTPLPDGLVGHIDAALKQKLLHVAVAQRKSIVEPDAMADDLTGEAVVLVACGISGWRHVGCLFGGWLGLGGGITTVIMSRAGKEGQQLDIYGPARA